MDINELAKGFISGTSGMCDKGRNGLMGASSIADLVTEYWRGIDFCLSKNYPRLRVMRRFQDEFRNQHVYLGESVSIANEKRAAFLDGCTVEFTADRYAVSYLYVKHNSIINIKASGHAYVMIDALEDSVISVECIENAKVTVNLYARASVSSSGENIKIVHKNMETYDL